MNPAEAPRTAAVRHRIDGLDLCVLLYLALPNVLFLLGWIKPGYGVPAATMMVLALAWTARRPIWRLHTLAPRAIWICAAIALGWLLDSGIGHFVYANTDWWVRDAVLRDLAGSAWPVQYQIGSDALLIVLRAPLGFFLPAAALAHVLGTASASWLLFGWCWLGVCLSFLLLSAAARNLRVATLMIVVFIFFSGLDLVGQLLLNQTPSLGEHLEWWARLFQYSSNTTQLFWVPNHALPAWLVALWLVRSEPWPHLPIPFAIILVALVPIWSPLAAIGLVPLVLVLALRELLESRAPWRVWLATALDPAMLVVAALVLGLIAPFLLTASETVPASWVAEHVRLVPLLERTALFVLLEFAIYWGLLWTRFRFDLLLTTAGVILLVLPWYRFGPGSDLTMRASIPALVVLSVRLAQWFAERLIPAPGLVIAESLPASLAMLVFIVGMATPFQEMVRPLIESEQVTGETPNVYQATQGSAPHYLAPRQGRWMERFLAPPGQAAIGLRVESGSGSIKTNVEKP